MPRTLRLVAEAVCWSVGLVSVVFYLIAVAHGEIGRRDAISAYTGVYSTPDRSAWSQGRIDALDASVAAGVFPAAILRIARVDLEVPVFTDATESNLNRGAGLIAGTAAPGSDGNIGVAAHRDGYFRALSDVVVGDFIELDSPSGRRVYQVSELSIVDPTDISPLHESGAPMVTLVTCYPFYFAGSAPKRYIVRAVLHSEKGVTP